MHPPKMVPLTQSGPASSSARETLLKGGLLSETELDSASAGRDGLRRAVWDWAAARCDWRTIGLGSMLRLAFRSLLISPELLRLAVPGSASRSAWTEFRNKSEAFRLFWTAGETLKKVASHGSDLARAVCQAGSLEPYEGLWSTEGLGYFYASGALRGTERMVGLLVSQASYELPTRSLIPLHTGMGLALALAFLSRIVGPGSHGQVQHSLAQYISLCRDNALPGYADAALEALGLVTELVRPTLVDILDKELAESSPELLGLFWHGVGRGLYFSPARALPCGDVVWPGVITAYNRPPHLLARDNAVAGFAWAVTLVNGRDPDDLDCLVQVHEAKIPPTDAWAQGVAAAAALWHAWSPQERRIECPTLRGWGTGPRICAETPRCWLDRPGDLFQYRQW
jgi:hypothetical protein